MIEIDLSRKTAVITGAARGIGLEIAKLLSRAGARIYLIDIDEESLKETATKLGSSYKALDVSDFKASALVLKDIFEEAGSIDILVNNAGITRDKLILRMKEDDFDAVIKVNLKSVFNLTKHVVPFMLKKNFGRIINISSIVGLTGNVGQTNYAAAKAGIIGLTKTIAKETALRNITVNAIAPGFIDTPMTASLKDDIKERLLDTIPMGRYGLPSEVASAVLFLASDLASYITAQTISVNGGMF